MDRFIKYINNDKPKKLSSKRKYQKGKVGQQQVLSNGAIGEWKLEGEKVVFRIVKGVKGNTEYIRNLREKRKSAEQRRKLLTSPQSAKKTFNKYFNKNKMLINCNRPNSSTDQLCVTLYQPNWSKFRTIGQKPMLIL